MRSQCSRKSKFSRWVPRAESTTSRPMNDAVEQRGQAQGQPAFRHESGTATVFENGVLFHWVARLTRKVKYQSEGLLALMKRPEDWRNSSSLGEARVMRLLVFVVNFGWSSFKLKTKDRDRWAIRVYFPCRLHLAFIHKWTFVGDPFATPFAVRFHFALSSASRISCSDNRSANLFHSTLQTSWPPFAFHSDFWLWQPTSRNSGLIFSCLLKKQRIAFVLVCSHFSKCSSFGIELPIGSILYSWNDNLWVCPAVV